MLLQQSCRFVSWMIFVPVVVPWDVNGITLLPCISVISSTYGSTLIGTEIWLTALDMFLSHGNPKKEKYA